MDTEKETIALIKKDTTVGVSESEEATSTQRSRKIETKRKSATISLFR